MPHFMNLAHEFLIEPFAAQLANKFLPNTVRLQVFFQLISQTDSTLGTNERLDSRVQGLEMHYESAFVLKRHRTQSAWIFVIRRLLIHNHFRNIFFCFWIVRQFLNNGLNRLANFDYFLSFLSLTFKPFMSLISTTRLKNFPAPTSLSR